MNTHFAYTLKALATVVTIALISGCGSKTTEAAPTQLAAKVNKGEISIHQVNFVLQKQPVPAEQLGKIRKEVIDRLVDQELIVQQALADKLDRDPDILQRLEAARREVLARSYSERMASKIESPTPTEVEAFFAANPLLFENRRVYKSSMITIPARPIQWEKILSELKGTKTIDSAADVLKAYKVDLPITRNASFASESLPLELLPAFQKLAIGEVAIYPQGQQIIVAEINEIKSVPVTKAQAGPVIEQFIINKKKSESVRDELKRLKDAAQISYLGEFALPKNPADKAPPTTPSPQSETTTNPTSTTDKEAVTKGLQGGLK